MKVLDLFSGIGGFSLGLERAGMETVAFCENDKFCQKVLAKHWPDVPVHTNIEELDGREYKGTVDLICGGFPCQPFSVAGQQRGKEDDRALWPEMLRVIREVEPAWIIGENVPGIINMELDNVLSDLEGAGYSCQTFVIPACAVDAKHRRDRVWIIASHTNFKSKPGGSQYEAERSRQLDGAHAESEFSKRAEPEGNQRGKPEIPTGNRGHAVAHANSGLGNQQKEQIQAGRNAANSSGEDVADTSIKRLQGSEETGDSLGSGTNREQLSARFGGVSGRDKPSAQPGMGGMVDGVSRWMDEPEGIPRVIGKVPDRVHRLKALGNAVVPQVVEVLGRMVMKIENERILEINPLGN